MSATTWVSGIASPLGCVTDGTYLYITDTIDSGTGYGSTITRILLTDNTSINNYIFAPNNSYVATLAIDPTYLYTPTVDNSFLTIKLILISTMTGDGTSLLFTPLSQYTDEFGTTYDVYPNVPSGLSVAGDYLYCSHYSDGIISRYYLPSITIGDSYNVIDYYNNLGGLLTNAGPNGLATDNTNLYIGCSVTGNIISMNLSTLSTTTFKTGMTSVNGLYISGSYLYAIVSSSSLVQIEISTGNTTILLSSGLSTPISLSGSGGYFYITNYATGGVNAPHLNDGYITQFSAASPSNDTSLSTFTIDTQSVIGGGTVTVAFGTTTADVYVETTSTAASIQVNGGSSSTGSNTTTVSGLTTGSNTVTVYVLAEDGVTTSTYYGYITVESDTPAASSDVSLSTFTIETSPVNDGDTVVVSYGATSVAVVVVTTSSAASISVDLNEGIPSTGTGSVSNTFSGLAVGTNALNVNVLAEDAVTSYKYTISIYRNSVPCFGEDTKILCFNGEKSEEEYIQIKDIRKGTLVKTVLNGYIPVDMIGKSTIQNSANDDRNKERLYKCTKDKYPEIVGEDLILTGGHSILVDTLSEEQEKKTKETINKIYVTDKKFRLFAFLDPRAEPYKVDGEFPIFHIALESDNDRINYGVYANGLLVETCSKRYMKEYSNMTLIE